MAVKYKPMVAHSVRWWESLSLEDKQKHKKHYEEVYIANKTYSNPYPSLSYTNDTRISKLTEAQINSIWRFHNFDIKTRTNSYK